MISSISPVTQGINQPTGQGASTIENKYSGKSKSYLLTVTTYVEAPTSFGMGDASFLILDSMFQQMMQNI